MIIGVPKEVKNNENRVGLTPGGVYAYVKAGHTVLVEKNAGSGSFFEDQAYVDMGAKIVDTADEAWSAEMVVKVKEPLAEEFDRIQEDSQMLIVKRNNFRLKLIKKYEHIHSHV